MLAGLQAVRAGALGERSGLPSRDRRGLMDCGKAESTSARPPTATSKLGRAIVRPRSEHAKARNSKPTTRDCRWRERARSASTSRSRRNTGADGPKEIKPTVRLGRRSGPNTITWSASDSAICASKTTFDALRIVGSKLRVAARAVGMPSSIGDCGNASPSPMAPGGVEVQTDRLTGSAQVAVSGASPHGTRLITNS